MVAFRRPSTSGGTTWPSNWHRFQTNATVTNSCYPAIFLLQDPPSPLTPSRCICIPSSKPGIQLAFLYLHDCKIGHVKNEFDASCDKTAISPERKVVLTSGFNHCKLEKNRTCRSGFIFHLHVGCIISVCKKCIFLPFSLNMHFPSQAIPLTGIA
jgi:hypothetical protein